MKVKEVYILEVRTRGLSGRCREGKVDNTDIGVSIVNKIIVTVKEERYFPTLVRAGEIISITLNMINNTGIRTAT